MVDDVVQVVERQGRDRELASVAAESTSRPRVGRDRVVEIGHGGRRTPHLVGNGGRPLRGVAVAQCGLVLIPVGKARYVFVEHQLERPANIRWTSRTWQPYSR